MSMDLPTEKDWAKWRAMLAEADFGGDLLIDTHAHISVDAFDADRDAVLARAKEAHVGKIIDMGDSMESSARAVHLAESSEMLYTAVGIHPEEARPMTAEDDDRLAAWAGLPKVVGIGEIGLDYYWVKDEEQRALQRKIFIRQLDLARQLHLPVCIHDRDAHGDMLAILKKEGRGIRGVLHCYSGSWETARELLKLGFFLGMDGPLTFKNAKAAPEIVQQMPLDYLLIETDCPYMAPAPLRGKRNEPAFVAFIAKKVAELRHIPLAEAARQTTKNARELYGI